MFIIILLKSLEIKRDLMSSTTQNTYKPAYDAVDDIQFSDAIFKFSKLRSPSSTKKAFSNIKLSFGSLVEDENGNVFYDARVCSEKPPWGHNHPILLRYSNYNLPYLIAQYNIKLKEKENHNKKTYESNLSTIVDPIISKLLKYHELVLVKGNRLSQIELLLKENLKVQGIKIDRLSFSFNFKDKSLTLRLCEENCILINEKNFINNRVNFNISSAITNEQIEDFSKRINNIFQGNLCL